MSKSTSIQGSECYVSDTNYTLNDINDRLTSLEDDFSKLLSLVQDINSKLERWTYIPFFIVVFVTSSLGAIYFFKQSKVKRTKRIR
jgi:hypothetical protein